MPIIPRTSTRWPLVNIPGGSPFANSPFTASPIITSPSQLANVMLYGIQNTPSSNINPLGINSTFWSQSTQSTVIQTLVACQAAGIQCLLNFMGSRSNYQLDPTLGAGQAIALHAVFDATSTNGGSPYNTGFTAPAYTWKLAAFVSANFSSGAFVFTLTGVDSAGATVSEVITLASTNLIASPVYTVNQYQSVTSVLVTTATGPASSTVSLNKGDDLSFSASAWATRFTNQVTTIGGGSLSNGIAAINRFSDVEVTFDLFDEPSDPGGNWGGNDVTPADIDTVSNTLLATFPWMIPCIDVKAWWLAWRQAKYTGVGAIHTAYSASAGDAGEFFRSEAITAKNLGLRVFLTVNTTDGGGGSPAHSLTPPQLMRNINAALKVPFCEGVILYRVGVGARPSNGPPWDFTGPEFFNSPEMVPPLLTMFQVARVTQRGRNTRPDQGAPYYAIRDRYNDTRPAGAVGILSGTQAGTVPVYYCQPGPGGMDVIGDTNQIFSMTPGRLRAQGTTVSGERVQNTALAIARRPGRAVHVRLFDTTTPGPTSTVRFGYGYPSSASNFDCGVGLVTDGLNFNVRHSTGFINLSNLIGTLPADFLFVPRSAYNGGGYILHRAAGATQYTLDWVYDRQPSGQPKVSNQQDFYARALAMNSAGQVVDVSVSGLTVWDLGNQNGVDWTSDTGPATSYTAAPANPQTQSTTADGMGEVLWTPAANETYELRIRYLDDNNCWIVRCIQASSVIRLVKRAASVETVFSTAFTWTVGTQYRIQVSAVGNVYQTYVTDVTTATNAPAAKVSTSGDSFQSTQTGLKSTGGATTANLAWWPRLLTITDPAGF